MKKLSLILSINYLFAWQMQGFTSEIINLPNTKIWCYQNSWKNNFNYKNYPKITKIEGGEACWVYNKVDSSNNKIDTYNWHTGWNFVTPIFENWNLDNKFRGNALIGWRYKNNKWYVYNYNLTKYGIENFNTLNIGEGMFVYIPKIEAKINRQAIFCKEGECSKIITANKEYKFYLKVPKTTLKFGLDLYRYSNNKHYLLAIGPIDLNNLNSKIATCVEKEGVGGSCKQIDNKNGYISYNNGYLQIDAQKIANSFNKSIPNTKEKFLVKFYIEGVNLDNFVDEKFGTLGIEGFGTWVTLNNSKRIQFEMEIR